MQAGATAKGAPLYEYRPHPQLSAIVLEGARRYLAGDVGFGDLARWADREGYRTPRGRALTDEWCRNVLGNPLNAGYVGYRRKCGGTELRKAAFEGFMSLEVFQELQETRRRRTRMSGHPAHFKVYPLSGATCASCGGKVTAQSDSWLRCRPAAQHAGCSERSVSARVLEDEFGAWLQAVVTLDAKAPYARRRDRPGEGPSRLGRDEGDATSHRDQTTDGRVHLGRGRDRRGRLPVAAR